MNFIGFEWVAYLQMLDDIMFTILATTFDITWIIRCRHGTVD